MVGTDKMEPICALAGRQGLERTTLTSPHTPAPKEATSLYPLGTAKVDALVGPTADHLDVSAAWKRRWCIR